MANCWHCGEEIEFRYVDDKCVPIHISGNWCEGYPTDYTGTDQTINPTDINYTESPRRERAWSSWQTGHARSDLGVPLTHPTFCPICGAHIFFHTNGNGDVVFFDELGWPWPKHGCLSTDSGVRKASNLPSAHDGDFERIANLIHVPRFLPILKDDKVNDFDNHKVGKKVLGVIIRHKNKTVWKQFPNSYQRERLEVLSVTLKVDEEYIRIFTPLDSAIVAGQIIEVTLEDVSFDNRSVLFAQHYNVVKPPEIITKHPKMRINLITRNGANEIHIN